VYRSFALAKSQKVDRKIVPIPAMVQIEIRLYIQEIIHVDGDVTAEGTRATGHQELTQRPPAI
jgi:hypothetical protein